MDTPVEFVKQLLPTVVNIHATVPRQHPSTRILGDERMGSGLVVDAAGLILTVNYVVMGASTIDVARSRAGACGPRWWPRTSRWAWRCCA